MIIKPDYSEVPKYFHPFIELVKGNDLVAALISSQEMTIELFRSIPLTKENDSYAVNKWSIKEVLRHIIDCERVYTYRAFRFSRFDQTELAGFDEERYINEVSVLSFSLTDLLQEYDAVRKATIGLFRFMNEKMLDFQGTANGFNMTARALGYLTVGHNIHHNNFIIEKYL